MGIPCSRVIAFEPLALNSVAIRRSLCRNPGLAPHVVLHERALAGDAREDCTLVSLASNVGDGTLVCGKPPGWQPAAGFVRRPGSLEFVRLDDFLCAHDVADIAFAKIDVEVRSATQPKLSSKLVLFSPRLLCVSHSST